jgi:riboflavin kinase / FMN adenylyltransferase
MEVIREATSCPRPPEGCAVTIGQYDGVHLGHRALIAELHRLAGEEGLRTAVVTFDRHPASVVRPESAPQLLTDLDQKLELLATTGADYVYVVAFDRERSREPAERFVDEVLVGCLNARAVAVGADFHFGHGRRGNVALLTELGAHHGFSVTGLGLVGPDGRPASDPVSSTAVRALLEAGSVEEAAGLLGRPHEVRGVVQRGDRRGRELGFPTANVAVPAEIQLPADGIYAGWLVRHGVPGVTGALLPAAISLGRRPTFYADQDASLLEVHVLDFDGDLYGEEVRVRFTHRLRGEQRFDAVGDLVDQMVRDCERARQLLAPR